MEVLIELNKIRYFWKVLKPSIKVKIDQHAHTLDSFEELVEKKVEIKAKAALQPGSYAHETDQRCLRRYCLAHINATNAQTQKF